METRKMILVVDDSSANLKLCSGLLCDEYDVRLAKSGKMALVALSRMRPDAILLDIEMPEMSGFEVLDEIRKNPEWSAIPVIFATSHASEEFIDKAAGCGADDYIVKPFAPDLLRAKIKGALASDHFDPLSPQ